MATITTENETVLSEPPSETAEAGELFDTALASDGLTIDTPAGPVDLVAVQRAGTDRRGQLTPAEIERIALPGHAKQGHLSDVIRSREDGYRQLAETLLHDQP